MINKIDSDIKFNKYILESDKNYIVCKFYAEWCVPCKKMEAFVEYCAKTYNKNINYIKMDADDVLTEEIMDTYSITNLPTFLIMNKGDIENYEDKIVGSDEMKLEEKLKRLDQTFYISDNF